MGNNSNTNETNTNVTETSETSEEETYTTFEGYEIPRDGHDESWMHDFNNKISDWVHTPEDSPDDYLTDDEIDYIINNMEDSLDLESDDTLLKVENGQLTRAEAGYHLEGIKVGDTLPSNSVFRSFSRTREATAEYLDNVESNEISIIRTNGSVPHYNVTKLEGYYYNEKESLVQTGNLKVDKITKINIDDFDSPVEFIDYVGEQLGYVPPVAGFDKITFYDVSSTE